MKPILSLLMLTCVSAVVAEQIVIECPVREPQDYFGHIIRHADKSYELFLHQDSGWHNDNPPDFEPLSVKNGKVRTNSNGEAVFKFKELDFTISNGNVVIHFIQKGLDKVYSKKEIEETMKCKLAYKREDSTF